jgi:intergrase/recombinase
MLEGLKQSNISMEFDKKIVDEMVKDLKEEYIPEIVSNRAIDEPQTIIEQISNTHYSLSLVASLQLECGLRVSESYEVVSNFDKYYNEDTNLLDGIIGKGNHEYDSKDISLSLAISIQSNNQELPTQRTYSNVLSEHGISSHDFRYTFAKSLYEEKLENGENYNQILKDISKELNHTREQMTRYYLARC